MARAGPCWPRLAPAGYNRRVSGVRPGDVVESDVDLAALHGPDRFERQGGPTSDRPGTSFPNGQVSSGHQYTTTGRDGLPFSGTREQVDEFIRVRDQAAQYEKPAPEPERPQPKRKR